MAEEVATLEPDAAANNAHAPTDEIARLPGSFASTIRMNRNKPFVSCASVQIYPISRNIGTALKFQLPTRL